jgi:hypothetical protein
MKKIITLIGLVFLVGCSIIAWTNYVNPCPPDKTIFVDTCIVDTFGISGIDTQVTKFPTIKIDTLKK